MSTPVPPAALRARHELINFHENSRIELLRAGARRADHRLTFIAELPGVSGRPQAAAALPPSEREGEII